MSNDVNEIGGEGTGNMNRLLRGKMGLGYAQTAKCRSYFIARMCPLFAVNVFASYH